MSAGTKGRAIRIPDELWEPAKATADRLGIEGGVSGQIRADLEVFVKKHQAPAPPPIPGLITVDKSAPPEYWPGAHFRGPAGLMPAFRSYNELILGCRCEAWQVDDRGVDGAGLKLEDAAWDHLEECLPLMRAAQEAGLL